MTEQEWLASEDPAAMLKFVQRIWPSGLPTPNVPASPRISDRKLRLFACACFRALWSFMGERDQAAIVLAERWADGEDVHAELHDLFFNVKGLARMLHWADVNVMAISVIDSARRHNTAILPAYASLFRDIIGNPFRKPPELRGWDPVECEVCLNTPDDDGEIRHGKGCYVAEEDGGGSTYADLEILVPWLTPTVLSLANAAYDELQADGRLDPLRLRILADALEESGWESPYCVNCVNGVWGEYEDGTVITCNCCCSDLLKHLRSHTPHYRGCWAIDLILGKR